MKHILLPVDLQGAAKEQQAVQVAVAQAKAFGARLHMISVVPELGGNLLNQVLPEGYRNEVMALANAKLEEWLMQDIFQGIPIEAGVVSGVVYSEILRKAEQSKIDLIIIASQRSQLPDFLLGSNAAKVVRHAKCSVMVVRH